MLNNIPDELKQRKQWVVYNKKKHPINARTSGGAMSNNKTTWSTYDEAVDAYNRGVGIGLGYMFDNDYIGVDLDKCFNDDGSTKEWAKEILTELYPSYIEKSMSGKGVHIILKRTHPLPGKGLNVNFPKYDLYDNVGGFEVYETGRYFALTGNILSEKTKEIQGSTDKIIPFYLRFKQMMEKPKPKPEKYKQRQMYLDDDDIFAEVKRNVRLHDVIRSYGYSFKRGWMCCPFHKEKTASFKVYQDDYYCFGCQEYGDVIDFVRLEEGLSSNIEATKVLNEKYNLNLFEDKKDKKEKKDTKEKEVIKEITEDDILNYAYDLSAVPEYNPNKAEIVKSGIPTLDKHIGGFELGKTTVWTGTNAAGKSTVLGQAMVESIEQGYNVFAFSGELQAHKFQYWIDLQSAGSSHLKQETSSITNQTYYKLYKDAQKKIHEWYKDKFFLYNNQKGMSYTEILRVMEAFHKHKKCKVFLIDNVMRLDLRTLDRDMYEAQSQFINSIADFAQNKNVHVHIVAHPRKIMGSVITKMDISGSGDLTNRADNVLAVHRVTAAYKEEMSRVLKGNKTAIDAIMRASNVLEIFKCRETGVQDLHVTLKYHADSKRIVDMSDEKLASKQYGWETDNWVDYPKKLQQEGYYE